jgi:hypothetical protein
MSGSKGSKRGDDANYTKVSFWLENQFWEREGSFLSESSKQYYRKWLRDWTQKERSLAAIDKTLK